MRDSSKETLACQVWLDYFNRTLYRKGHLTLKEFLSMKAAIQRRSFPA